MSRQVGVVVPTMGSRPQFILNCLRSIRESGNAFILIVAPDLELITRSIPPHLYDRLLLDPKLGLPSAINLGIADLPGENEFVTWLGDDDLLEKDSLSYALAPLLEDKACVLSFGGCKYINSNGEVIWSNHSGRYAVPLLRFGPQMIPQPGSLIRRTAFNAVGGLDNQYKWAFDLDLFIRLRQLGRLRFVNQKLASFRWHEGSLSVGGRAGSVREASHIRKNSLPLILRLCSPIWEFPLRKIIMIAGFRISRLVSKPIGTI
jgi:GT2 family glycosyltransferase